MTDAGIRPAQPGDADAIARLQVATWLDGYAALFPPGTFDGLPVAGVSARWAEAISHPPTERHRLLVAVDGIIPVGFAASAPADESDADPATTGEITTLLVAASQSRRGHGSRMLAATVACLRADGASHAVTWLLANDLAGQGLYTTSGWAPDGARRDLAVGVGTTVTEVRLHTDLRE